jgi:hypothetical protein
MSSMDTTCRRCGHHVPNDQFPGEYPGALSRTEGPDVTVCGPCGNDEGVKQRSGVLEARDEWPIVVDQKWYDVAALGARLSQEGSSSKG